MKTDLFQSCGHCWVFQMCLHIECSTFTASSSRIWNSSTGIPPPPLALFAVMLLRPIWLHIPALLDHTYSAIMQCLSFCAWFVSFSVNFSRLTHVAENGRISFLFHGQTLFRCIHKSYFLCLFICLWTFFKSYLFILGYAGLLPVGFLWLWCTRAALNCGALASLRWLLLLGSTGIRCVGFSSCSVWVGSTAHRLQSLWRRGLVADWHVESSQTRDQTCVPSIGRRILNHCTPRNPCLWTFRF